VYFGKLHTVQLAAGADM